MELSFPLEFIVNGTAVSLQGSAKSVKEWKERIRDSSKVALPENHFAHKGSVAVTLYYFPSDQMQGDVDNIVKPILDALNAHIYMDDVQIHRIVVQKFEPGNVFGFTSPSATLIRALNGQLPLLYVRLSDNPHEELK